MTGGLKLFAVLVEIGASPTRADARRCTNQGAVRLNGSTVTDVEYAIPDGFHAINFGKQRKYHIAVLDGQLADYCPRRETEV